MMHIAITVTHHPLTKIDIDMQSHIPFILALYLSRGPFSIIPYLLTYRYKWHAPLFTSRANLQPRFRLSFGRAG